jgi:mycoredoxin
MTSTDQDSAENRAGDVSAFTMYTTPWCGFCFRLKGQLKREQIAFDEVNIEQHPEAADLVARINHGNQTVPTLVFSDGSSMTNPSVREVTAKLASL